MGSGKLAGLLIAGALAAGALAAGATTHSMRSYHGTAPDSARLDQAHPSKGQLHKSWLEEGLSMLDSPAWPFGRDEWDGTANSKARADTDDDSGYTPQADDDVAPDDTGPGDYTPAASDDFLPQASASADIGPDADIDAAVAAPPQNDAAAAAAARADVAAQDALAAEHGQN